MWSDLSKAQAGDEENEPTDRDTDESIEIALGVDENPLVYK